MWQPSDEASAAIDGMLRGLSELLTPRGRYIQMSFRQPEFRVKNFLKVKDDARYGWFVKAHRYFAKSTALPYFFYVMQKGKEV